MVTVTITIKPYLARYMYVRYAQSLEPESESRSSPSSPASPPKPVPIRLSHITPLSIISYTACPSRIHLKHPGKKLGISHLYCPIQPMERIPKRIII